MKNFILSMIGLFLASVPLYADVLVKSSRFDQLNAHHSGSVLTYDLEALKAQRDTSVQDFLQRSSSFYISKQGAPGSSSSAFLRGQDASSLAVYIDGVLVNDPTNPSRSFDFGHLSLANIQSIKVYQGPQTVLHGASALGGVVSIKTLEPKEKNQGHASYQFERYNTHDIALNYQGGKSKLKWGFGVNHKKAEGFSSAKKSDSSSPTPDGREFNQLQLSLQRQTWNLKARYQKDRFDLDGFDPQSSLPVDRRHDSGEDEQWQISSRWQDSLSDAIWADYLFSYKSSQRETFQAEEKFRFQARSWQAKLEHQWQQSSKWSSFFGIESFLEEGVRPLNKSRRTSGLYWLQHYENKGLVVSMGLRLESHQSFDEATALSFSLGRNLTDQQSLKYNFSTSYRAPSLSELFDPQYGNKNLDPETSEHHELTWTYSTAPHLQLQSSLFSTRTRSRISFDNKTLQSVNKGQSAVYGVEAKLNRQIPKYNLNVQADATLLKAYDLESGSDLLRRPRHKWGLGLEYALVENFDLNTDITWVSERDEFNGDSLPQYTQVDITLKYSRLRGLELWGGVENIFDEPNSGGLGYTSPGVVWNFGLAQNF